MRCIYRDIVIAVFESVLCVVNVARSVARDIVIDVFESMLCAVITVIS